MILAFGFWDIIKVPFGYVLEWLYNWTANYGLALILFSLVLKLILYPTSAKSKKSMMKMSRISPQVKLLELKYGDDKESYQKAVQKLYKDENVSMTGGCLWSLIPLIVIIPLYQVIRQPIQYMMHVSSENAALILEGLKKAAPSLFAHANDYYHQMIAASHVGEYADQIKDWVPDLGKTLHSLNFNFLGIDLGQVPDWKIWKIENLNWAAIGLVVLPIVAALTQMLSMLLSQKMNNQVATNAQGERDDAAAAMANQTNKSMMLFMPIMSLVFCFTMPAAISVYWIAQAVFGMIQDYFLTKHYRKIYDAEDEEKRKHAAELARIEAEKEKRRALRREKNPDLAVENTSKKKLPQPPRHTPGSTPRKQGPPRKPRRRNRATPPSASAPTPGAVPIRPTATRSPTALRRNNRSVPWKKVLSQPEKPLTWRSRPL